MSETLSSQYKDLCKTILHKGVEQETRNGMTLTIPNYSFTVDDMENDHELLLRKMYYTGVTGEFLTLLDATPLTNVSQFVANGCNYWGLWAKEDGSINVDYHNKLHPQLEDVIENIKQDPYSRRHVVSLWDHESVKSGKLSLPNCWHSLTFSVIGDTLHLTWAQRSVDTMVGLPSDIYLAYLFMKHVSKEIDLKVGSCMFALSNVHIYAEHLDKTKELLLRDESFKDTPLKFELKG